MARGSADARVGQANATFQIASTKMNEGLTLPMQ